MVYEILAGYIYERDNNKHLVASSLSRKQNQAIETYKLGVGLFEDVL